MSDDRVEAIRTRLAAAQSHDDRGDVMSDPDRAGRTVRIRTPEERAAYVPPPDVPCGFCGQMTYPGLKWPALDGSGYVWCCEDCEHHLEEEDDRVLAVKVRLDDD